ncbi:helix-turn-helix transcriptional regulator [Litoribrevibacter albus]|uniref:HTH luxR-type domain-containing protein n=1 Tax=Litoribrevibacter albus TaxID=1473156 RepID=A0AA37SF47_9GAMM|nr:helix-turn-helix transcriptional regulator [Litoribrevibacter albus]GLQ33573.1 hypothetical protein GCM10007876_40530 [Litoribrevibacter albus]
MFTDPKLITLFINRLYSAVTRPGDLLNILSDLQEQIDSPHAAFQVENLETHDLKTLHMLGYNEQSMQTYEDYFVTCDPWTKTAYARNLDNGVFITGQRILSDKDYRNSEFYIDWGKPFDVCHAIGTSFLLSDGYHAKVSFQRGREQGAFSEEIEAALNLLRPHFGHYIRLAPIFEVASRYQFHWQFFIHQLDRPVFVVDKSLKVIMMNREAEQWMKETALLGVSHGQLFAPDSRQHSHLQKSIDWASHPETANSATLGFVQLYSGEQSENLWTLPLIDFEQSGYDSTGMALLIARRRIPHCKMVMEKFSLSQRQAELCLLILEGKTLEEISQDMNVALNTTRNTLIACFSKLGVRNQVQLIQLLLTRL